MLKIYLYPLLSSLGSQIASTFINFLATISFDITEDMYDISVKRIFHRIHEGTFSTCVTTYLDRLLSIDQHIK